MAKISIIKGISLKDRKNIPRLENNYTNEDVTLEHIIIINLKLTVIAD